ncbi:conserved hypothetical protein [Candidatus Desulfarcum epimagneticum]|uniref:Glycine cleavage system protein H n=1 Tax=uncultured Desulfobacteraceae bacterium TaxID=218296 RepID=A0A484HN67_9BACT|nr:conserved hypothetical protein [uncultured Desulfobacteraceae bacterium]
MKTPRPTRSTEKEKNAAPCLWTQAGVVRRKQCRIDYDCARCGFDKRLTRMAETNRRLKREGKTPGGKKGAIVFWTDKLNARPPWRRPCVHHMKGRIDFRACPREYECRSCEFDQFFTDRHAVHAAIRPTPMAETEGFKIPVGFYFHPGHTWAKIEENGAVRVGIDDFALRVMGPLDAVIAPLAGKTVTQGAGDIRVVRGEKTARLKSPVSGVVTEVNHRLRDRGALANREPFSGGWALRIHSGALRREVKNLMMGQEAQNALQEDIDAMRRLIGETGDPLAAADGGNLGHDIFGSMPGLGWERLTGRFF